MKFKNYLQEEWVALVRRGSVGHNIYSNPSTSELKELRRKESPAIRYIIDDRTETLYVFAWNLLHDSAMKELQIDRNDPDIYTGEAEISPRGKIKPMAGNLPFLKHYF